MCNTGNPTKQFKWLVFDIEQFSVCLAASTRRTSRFSARWSHLIFALISGRLGERESDALTAGSCEEEASRDPDSPELLNFFLRSSSATGSETTGRGWQLWS